MTTKSQIIAAIQAVADASGSGNIRIALGEPGEHVKNSIGEIRPTGNAWIPEPKTWPVVVEGLAIWLDSTGGFGKVKVTAVDTLAGWLSQKIVAGAGVAINLLNPGADEKLEVVATGTAPAAMLQGSGAPNATGVIGSFIGQKYQDVDVDAFYVCVVSGTPSEWKFMAATPMTGSGNPDGATTGVQGQLYFQEPLGLVYLCRGGTAWSVV